jgi:hypothetical protein
MVLGLCRPYYSSLTAHGTGFKSQGGGRSSTICQWDQIAGLKVQTTSTPTITKAFENQDVFEDREPRRRQQPLSVFSQRGDLITMLRLSGTVRSAPTSFVHLAPDSGPTMLVGPPNGHGSAYRTVPFEAYQSGRTVGSRSSATE